MKIIVKNKLKIPSYTGISVYLEKCTNSTSNNFTCLPEDQIESELNGSFLNVIATDNDLKFDNLNNPIKPFTKSSPHQLSTTVYKKYFQEINQIIVKTDNNILFNSYSVQKAYKFSNKYESVDNRAGSLLYPRSFAQYNLLPSGYSKIYSRTYVKLLKVITQIGGFSNGMIFGAQIILFIYSSNIILWHCIFIILSNFEINQFLNSNNKVNSLVNNEDRIKSEFTIKNVKESKDFKDNENEGENNINDYNLSNNNNNKINLEHGKEFNYKMKKNANKLKRKFTLERNK